MQENIFSEKLWKAKVRDILETYQENVVLAIKDGYDGVDGTKWSFAGAFLYSLTVITTIGESISRFFFKYDLLAHTRSSDFCVTRFVLIRRFISDFSNLSLYWAPRECYCRGTSAFARENKTRWGKREGV